MRTRINVTDLRRSLFDVLKDVAREGKPVEISLHGRVIAELRPAPVPPATEKINRKRIARLCRRYKIKQLALFGSILRDDFGPESDVDVLYEAEPGTIIGLREHAALHEGLQNIFGRPVDLVRREVVERSDNPVRRRAILEDAQVVYGH